MFHWWFLTIFCPFSKRSHIWLKPSINKDECLDRCGVQSFLDLWEKERISTKLFSRHNWHLKSRTKKSPAKTLGHKRLKPWAFFRKNRLTPWGDFDEKWLALQNIFPSKVDNQYKVNDIVLKIKTNNRVFICLWTFSLRFPSSLIYFVHIALKRFIAIRFDPEIKESCGSYIISMSSQTLCFSSYFEIFPLR